MANIKAKAVQLDPSVVGNEDFDYLRMTKLGALYTADWRTQLALAGKVWSTSIGTLSAGADVGLIVGGGNGTTVDSDQPELILGVDAGYYLIPIEVNAMCDMDADADGEYGEVVMFMDTAAAPPTSATGTPGVLTPVNAIDGGASFPGRAFGGVTTDITDPTMGIWLAGRYFNTADNGTAASALGQDLNFNWRADFPQFFAGPCSLVVCYGGTAAVNGMIHATFAAIPSSWVPAT